MSWVLVTLPGPSDELDIFCFPGEGLKLGEIRDVPLAKVSDGQLWAHTPWISPVPQLGQDPVQLCKSTVDGICNASWTSVFKALSASTAQSWPAAVSWNSFLKSCWALNTGLCVSAVESGGQLRQTCRKSHFACLLELSPSWAIAQKRHTWMMACRSRRMEVTCVF